MDEGVQLARAHLVQAHGESARLTKELQRFQRTLDPARVAVDPESDIEVFVNWTGFTFYDPAFESLNKRFWAQMARLRPESYMGKGTVLSFATRNTVLFNAVIASSKEV